jgi:hypothetical protein
VTAARGAGQRYRGAHGDRRDGAGVASDRLVRHVISLSSAIRWNVWNFSKPTVVCLTLPGARMVSDVTKVHAQ